MRVRASGGCLAAALALLGAAPAAAAEPAPGVLRLPVAGALDAGDLLAGVGARPDRVLRSVVPGPVRNDEVVRVAVDGSGAAVGVQVEQRLRLSGSGDYQVRERGPARAARALGEEPPPVTRFGAVVWQGFSPGARELAALLTLDPALEAPRLPLAVRLSFVPAGGGEPVALGPGGAVPGAGTVSVVLVPQTAQPATLPTAAGVAARDVAPLLDALRAATGRPAGQRLPVAGAGLPVTLPVRAPAEVQGEQAVPLRVTGTVSAAGATVSGPGTTPVPDGARVAGTLGTGPVTFAVTVPGPARLALDLQAAPALDPRRLAPPAGARSWAAWAATGPGPAARRAALDLLVQAAATGARAAAYAPYLGADLPGSGTTAFRWTTAPAAQAAVVRPPLRPRRGPIALAGIAALLVLGVGAGVWRAS